MSKLKCVRDPKTKHVYCCDSTGELFKFPFPIPTDSSEVPPEVIKALLAGGDFELEAEVIDA